MRLPGVDLANPDLFLAGWPHEAFALLRAKAPVYWHEEANGPGFWVVSKYHDVRSVQLDAKTFSSARGGTLIREFDGEEREAIQSQLINMDAPRHTRFRRLVNMGFSPKMTNRLAPHIRDMATRIIDAVVARGECDFVAEIAAELPLQVIAEMIGIPLADRHLIFKWSNDMIGFDDPEYGGAGAEVGKIASMQMYMYANELAVERKKSPRDDVVSVLMAAEVDGEKLTEVEFDSFFLLLADPSLMPTAVEEMLRWVSPVMYFRRTATRDAELRGQAIREGDKLTVWYGSANRDEEVFPHADRFDVGRTPNEHLAFGIGHHFCLGANLARLEIQIMFEELLRRLPDLELAGPVERLRSNFINGIKRMPVRFTPERS